eukprot:jgi/Picre1/28645/NNA_004045.t1
MFAASQTKLAGLRLSVNRPGGRVLSGKRGLVVQPRMASFDRPAGGASRGIPVPADLKSSVVDSTASSNNGGSVSVSGEVLTNSVLGPAAIYEKASDMGAYKASLPWWKIMLLGAIAGAMLLLEEHCC